MKTLSNFRKYVCCLMLLVGATQRISAQDLSQFNPKNLSIEWEWITNDYEKKPQFIAALFIKNNDERNVAPLGWKLYFNLRYHGHTLSSRSAEFKIQHVSGDLFYITPTETFKGLKPGNTAKLEYLGVGRLANYQDIPSAFLWVNNNNQEKGIALPNATAREKNLPEPDAASLFVKNGATENIPDSKLVKILPTPQQYNETPGNFIITNKVSIVSDPEFDEEANSLSKELKKIIGIAPPIQKTETSAPSIVLKLNRSIAGSEAYRLTVRPEKIQIEASKAAGIFYGVQSLKSLLPPESWRNVNTTIQVQAVEVEDSPRFPFRAFMLDVARNFQSKEEILRVLEVMSLYKMNVFHFHLIDDEGWRLEIPGLSELTDIGARRGYPFVDNGQLHPSYASDEKGNHVSGNGYYTREDYIEIVKYANARHIQVIPEIESPGHARAAVKAMEARYKKFMAAGNTEEAQRYLLYDPQDKSVYRSNQYFNDNVMNVAMASTYEFIEKIIDEILSMHKAAGVPLKMIHMAGDEVPKGSWEKSPVANAFAKNEATMSTKQLWRYYFNRVKEILKERGLTMYGWQELVIGTQTDESVHVIDTALVKDNVQVDAWWNLGGNEDLGYKLANNGFKVVLSFVDHFYFDLAYSSSFLEPGDAWIGFIDIDKIYAFSPYDYYSSVKTDLRGDPMPGDYFKGKEQLTQKGKKNIIGIQGALWGENLTSADLMEYMLLPRLISLAERAWAPAPPSASEHDPQKYDASLRYDLSFFVNTLGKRELPRLDFYNGGYQYRIPTPGAKVAQGRVVVNQQLPGFKITYSIDGSEPTAESMLYSSPITTQGIIKLRAFDTRGRGSKTLRVENK